ncbi:hypothetical protein LTR64_003384 [Lithohypha guttulata]|uniref:uncharacterized protein n=1 Tax=Lithohypha guttulata TaxID=1690604 RepID=UPI002DDE9383|nr:hypothetical protein LTR51_000397 [Lithohypha guttulata]
MSRSSNPNITSAKDVATDSRQPNSGPTTTSTDEFGLPHRLSHRPASSHGSNDAGSDFFHDANDGNQKTAEGSHQETNGIFIEATSIATMEKVPGSESDSAKEVPGTDERPSVHPTEDSNRKSGAGEQATDGGDASSRGHTSSSSTAPDSPTSRVSPTARRAIMNSPIMKKSDRASQPVISEWSHQKLGSSKEAEQEEEEVKWQAMRALDEFDIYDDDGRLVAKGAKEDDEDEPAYGKLGGAGKGYTRLLHDDDADSHNSFEEDTDYLFKGNRTNNLDDEELEEDPRDMMQQLEATKDLLTEGQRIAYVGVVRLMIYKMQKALEDMERTRKTKKETVKALESMEIWGQQMMVRLYAHMNIDIAEQVMIEQLAEHGVEPADLAPSLMQNARVKNPLAETQSSQTPSQTDHVSVSNKPAADVEDLQEAKTAEEVPEVHGIEDAPKEGQIDLDIRWTILCDLFLILLADSIYDARSRRLLERVASTMDISWVQICRFEKRVIDQLEMEEAAKEKWDESEHMETRRKQALTRRYVMMGLATVGGGLVIGLSAGLLAPVIGAGLAAGFTTIGVTGTAGFLGGVGGAALVTSVATTAGGTIAVRAAHRRTGHVRTFEFRPLHNNKRLNLILTVSGWMTGKVDDVRLPFSSVDPIMGDIYSLHWEPEMLRSMGDTINILATEALTQSIQQVLGSTILVALMAAMQLPVVLTKLSYLIDNPWSVSLDRAHAAGLILADSLIARHLGQRPITLTGFSLGARVIFSCLKELSNRNAYGIVQNVYLFGSPIVANKDEYLRARSVIAGRFVNAYAKNDWILGYLFRATSGGIMKVAGLAPVENVPGLENHDVTELVNGHMAYRKAMPKLLRKFNWEVTSDEFTEIEDPDPENHEQRQRELIAEIDEARKKAEQKPEKRRFGLFKRGKLAEKKPWEMYDAKSPMHSKSSSIDQNVTEENMWGEGKVLFDIDAIRKELAGEQIEVRELDSNQPPIQITTIKNGEKVIESLRLPPGISMNEAKKMKLPPRPDEIDDESLPPTAANGFLQRATSASATPTTTITETKDKRKSLAPSPLPPAAEYEGADFMPKEIESTLPPLQLTPNPQLNSSPTPRPGLKSHTTTPLPDKAGWADVDYDTSKTSRGSRTPVGLGLAAAGGAGAGAGVAAVALASPVEALDLEHNAWGDDANGDISLTFA